MEKVQCKECGSTGFTASPECTRCKCGGSFRVILEKPSIVRNRNINTEANADSVKELYSLAG